MPVVDAHHHVWDLAAHDQPWLASDTQLAPLLRNFTIADLAAEAAAREVTATVLVQTVSEPCETPEMLALAASGGLVAEIVDWVDLESPDVAGSPAELRDLPGGAHRPAGPDSELTGEVASLRRTPGSAAYLARATTMAGAWPSRPMRRDET